MTDEQRTSDASRRRLIRALASGGAAIGAAGLPRTWTRPVVDSAILPAHAQATTEEPGGGGQLRTFIGTFPIDIQAFNGTQLRTEGIVDRLLDSLVPEAGATIGAPTATLRVFLQETTPSQFQVTMKFLEIADCRDAINTNEFSILFTGMAGGSLSGQGCNGASFPGTLNNTPNGPNMNVNGEILGMFPFSGTCVPGGSPPGASPCIDCPPISEDTVEF